MEFFLISILTTIGGIILYAIMGAAVKAPGTLLATKFTSLGDMSGKTYDEIKKWWEWKILFLQLLMNLEKL